MVFLSCAIKPVIFFLNTDFILILRNVKPRYQRFKRYGYDYFDRLIYLRYHFRSREETKKANIVNYSASLNAQPNHISTCNKGKIA